MNIRTFLLLSLIVPVASFAQAPYPGNDSDDGVTAGGFPNPYTGNISFSTSDITVAGAVGQYGLTWQRYATSRTSQTQDFFGLGHNWTHNWQYEMVSEGKDSQGRAVISVREPYGTVHRFAEVSPGQWWSTPNVTDHVVSSGDAFTLQHRGGGEARFTRQGDAFTLRELTDGLGNVWALTYSGGQLVQVTEPAGRWLKISYMSLQSASAPAGTPPYTVITRVTASTGQVVDYNYQFLQGTDYPVLGKATYPDSDSSSYLYAAPRAGARVLLTQADDPRGDQSVRGRLFRYRSETGSAIGQALEINAAAGGAIMQALDADSRDLRSYAVKQPNGSTVYQVYNPGGNISEITDALGFSRKYEYDSDTRGLLIAATDELGKVTRYEYSASGAMVKLIHPDSSSRSWKHDALDRVTVETDELGNSRTFSFNSRGQLTRTKDATGAVEEFEYNDFGQVLSRKERRGGISHFSYDERGLLRSNSDALGHATQIRYDKFDNISEVTDARGFSINAINDLQGRVTKVTYADGATESYRYSRFGDLLESTAAECDRCSARNFVYDEFGRRTEARDPVGNITKWEYAPIGSGAPFDQFVRTISPSGRITQIKFDANGRVIARTQAFGTPDAATTRYGYDPAGRQSSIVDAAGRTLQIFYNARGWMTKAMSAMNNATAYKYDAVGRKTSEIDAKGNTTQWTYDAEGREIAKVDAANQVTRRGYDAAGNLVSLTDAKGNITRFEYDLVGHQTAFIHPDGSREETTYDEVGNEQTYTNRAGAVRTFTYDSRNRETLSEWSDGSQRTVKAYDPAGRMTLADNGISKLTFAYDKAGRLVSETQDLYPVVTNGVSDPAPRVVSYEYTPDGERDHLTYPDGNAIKLSYNGRGQLTNLAANNAAAPIASYEYDVAGNATRMPRENLTETSSDYDADNRMTRIIERIARISSSSIDYRYDEVGNRITRTERNNTAATRDNYRYDNTYQVTGADYRAPLAANGAVSGAPEGITRLTYDAVGNRLQVDADGKVTRYAVNSLNQYTQVGEFAPQYDKNGNLASMGNWIYRYDAMNRLIEAVNGKVAAKFFYDARNRSVARIYNGEASANIYDDWNLIEELDASGQQRARYVHGRRIDEIVLMVNRHGAFYPHRDALGNVTMLTDSSGQVAERYAYSVDGKVTIKDANGRLLSRSAVDNRWAFTGREWLADVGLYDYRNRVYSPELGRFLQTDPIKFRAGDTNIYRYVFNRSLIFSDPSGLVCGNGTWGDYLTPDGIPGVFSAASACTIHDDIYGNGIYNGASMLVRGQWLIQNTAYTRLQADNWFLNRMRDINSNIFGQTFSYIYYGAVRLFGWLFWGGE